MISRVCVQRVRRRWPLAGTERLMSVQHAERLRLRYRPEDLFDLVSDVRRYPDFIQMISAMRVMRERVQDGTGELDAEARVRFRFVRERFTTRVRLDRSALAIDVEYLSGPFHDLANHWRFYRLEDGSSLVDFRIRYAFRNPLFQMLMDTNRTRAIRYLVHAFEGEASRRYQPVGADEYDWEDEARALPAAAR